MCTFLWVGGRYCYLYDTMQCVCLHRWWFLACRMPDPSPPDIFCFCGSRRLSSLLFVNRSCTAFLVGVVAAHLPLSATRKAEKKHTSFFVDVPPSSSICIPHEIYSQSCFFYFFFFGSFGYEKETGKMIEVWPTFFFFRSPCCKSFCISFWRGEIA